MSARVRAVGSFTALPASDGGSHHRRGAGPGPLTVVGCRLDATSISVIVADDQAMVRQGAALLNAQEDITVIADAEDGAQAVERVTRLQPDVVPMDVRTPVMDGLEAARRILSSGLTPPRGSSC